MTVPYLFQLTTRLADGLDRRPAAQRGRHAAYLAGRQNPDGGFSGREGGSDLYYTAFALRGLAVLGALTPAISQGAARFLRSSLRQEAGIIDFFSLLYACFLLQTAGEEVLADSPADWPDRVAGTLEGLRTPDSGYAKTPGGTSGSVYHTFLVGLCYQLLGRAVPAPDGIVAFVRSRRRDDGGFVEIAPMRRSGTNPTAAAVGLLQMLSDAGADGFLQEVRPEVVSFLQAMRSEEGGLRGNGRAPLADLLSTFTGLWTLDQLGALEPATWGGAREFVAALEVPAGGFRGGLWDTATDVEYTFYGLGCLALLPAGTADPP